MTPSQTSHDHATPQRSHPLKSYAFRREREAAWQRLDAMVERARRQGLRSLPTEELLLLPTLYRAALSALSVARSISLDQNVVRYLESLAARAYFCVYAPREAAAEGIAAFFRWRLPAAVRAARWPVLLAAACLLLGGISGFALTLANPDWYYTFVPAQLAGERSPTSTTEELRAVLYRSGDLAEMLALFAGFLFSHNAAIGILCFALGFALGVPVVLLMFYNGLVIGALAAIYHARGLSVELWAWLGIHGTTELLAVVLCGGAGLVLARSIIIPGRHTRLHNLASGGRQAGLIVIGAVVLFFVAALLEGFARQLVHDTTWRYLVALGMLAGWLAYFVLSGREDARAGGR